MLGGIVFQLCAPFAVHSCPFCPADFCEISLAQHLCLLCNGVLLAILQRQAHPAGIQLAT
jgi:hypothetical protein